MRKLMLFIYLSINVCVSSQNNISIQAVLIDENSLEHIPFATISFSNTDLVTTSDKNGAFKLVFSSGNLPDTINIRNISFKSKKMFLTKENFDSIKIIKLQTKHVEINNTIIAVINIKAGINIGLGASTTGLGTSFIGV